MKYSKEELQQMPTVLDSIKAQLEGKELKAWLKLIDSLPTQKQRLFHRPEICIHYFDGDVLDIIPVEYANRKPAKRFDRMPIETFDLLER